MKIVEFACGAILITIVSLFAGYHFVMNPARYSMGGIGDTSDTDRITERVPFRLVSPHWVRPVDGDIHIAWLNAEMHARFVSAAIVWLALLFLLSKVIHKTNSATQPPQPTATRPHPAAGRG